MVVMEVLLAGGVVVSVVAQFEVAAVLEQVVESPEELVVGLAAE
jgi:hypothetical protein